MNSIDVDEMDLGYSPIYLAGGRLNILSFSFM
jgi:hypothetical protein